MLVLSRETAQKNVAYEKQSKGQADRNSAAEIIW